MTTKRESLKAAYLHVVNNWAVGTNDVAKSLKITTQEASNLLNQLGSLVEGTHVNGERAITWQSYYDIENSDEAETLASANKDFDEAFPAEVETQPANNKNHATGPRYTDQQLQSALNMRNNTDASWAQIAEAVGVKTPYRLAKKVKELGHEVRTTKAAKPKVLKSKSTDTALLVELLEAALAEKRTSAALKNRIREALGKES